MKKKLLKRHKSAIKHLADTAVKKLIPMFVESGNSTADHKCGNCMFRVGKDQCALVKGKIDFKNGTCAWWAKGPAMKELKPVRMSQALSGYVTVGQGQKINCGTCKFFEKGYCKLWQGAVHRGDCCMVWDR